MGPTTTTTTTTTELASTTTTTELASTARVLDFDLRARASPAGGSGVDAESAAEHHVLSRGDAIYLEGTTQECMAFLTGWIVAFLTARSDPGTFKIPDTQPSSTSTGPRFRSQDVLHVLSQAGQPYGSERRCCNHCGIMIWGGEEPAHVDNWEDWRAAANSCQAMELA